MYSQNDLTLALVIHVIVIKCYRCKAALENVWLRRFVLALLATVQSFYIVYANCILYIRNWWVRVVDTLKEMKKKKNKKKKKTNKNDNNG